MPEDPPSILEYPFTRHGSTRILWAVAALAVSVLVGTVAAQLRSGANAEAEAEPSSRPVTTQSAEATSVTSQVTSVTPPCVVVQVATYEERSGALKSAGQLNAGSSGEVAVVGPSDWIPGWGEGRFVVFAPFAAEGEATVFRESLGGDSVVIDLPAGSDACKSLG